VPIVLEPRGGVIDKACGEGLMPGGVQALAALGVDPPGHVLTGIRYVAGRRSAQAEFRHGPGRGVRRTALHRSLRETVDAAGIDVLPLAATSVTQDSDAVTVGTARPGLGDRVAPVLRARYVIAADGLHSPTRRLLGLDAQAGPSTLRRYGLRHHYAIRAWSDYVEIHWGEHGEAYVTPVEEDLVGVAVLTRRRMPMEDSLADFPELRERLGGATPVTSVMGAGPLRQRATRRVAGRVLLAGDASGYVDALTGEGIALGLAHARAAVTAIAAGQPEDYERAWRAASRRYSLMTHALVQSTRADWARRALVPAAAALPAVFRAAVDELARPTR
jgi:flavin-dependent dehydrogenase